MRTAPAPPIAAITASRYISGRYGLTGIRSIRARESRRKHGWVLVTGRYSRPLPGGRFAVWLVFYDQRWIIKHAGLDVKAWTPPRGLGVPCDIRPAFSDPSC